MNKMIPLVHGAVKPHGSAGAVDSVVDEAVNQKPGVGRRDTYRCSFVQLQPAKI